MVTHKVVIFFFTCVEFTFKYMSHKHKNKSQILLNLCVSIFFAPFPGVSLVTFFKSNLANPGLSVQTGNRFSEQGSKWQKKCPLGGSFQKLCSLTKKKKKCQPLDSSNFYALIFQSVFNCEGKTLKNHIIHQYYICLS